MTDTERMNWLADRMVGISETRQLLILDWLDSKGNDFFTVHDRRIQRATRFRELVDMAIASEAELLSMEPVEYRQAVDEHRAMRRIYKASGEMMIRKIERRPDLAGAKACLKEARELAGDEPEDVKRFAEWSKERKGAGK
jgi:hypothetical protein